MVTVKKSMLIMALEHGGYVVKEHDVYNNKTDMLFAGSLGDCLNFLRAALQQKESKMITTTLNKIRAHNPCEDGWEKLLKGFGKTKADDEPLPFVQILEINGLDDALWCLRAEPQYAKEYRLLAVAYARHVQHLNPDPRVKNAIDVAERYANGEATDEELTAAKAAARAAWDDAGYAAARAAAGDYAGYAAGAAWDDARAAAGAAVWAAAGDAADAAARVAAWAAVWAAAGDAADAAAGDAERKWQKQEFIRVVTETEARGE